jgi:hypothetical protein
MALLIPMNNKIPSFEIYSENYINMNSKCVSRIITSVSEVSIITNVPNIVKKLDILDDMNINIFYIGDDTLKSKHNISHVRYKDSVDIHHFLYFSRHNKVLLITEDVPINILSNIDVLTINHGVMWIPDYKIYINYIENGVLPKRSCNRLN